MEYVIVIVINL